MLKNVLTTEAFILANTTMNQLEDSSEHPSEVLKRRSCPELSLVMRVHK